MVDMCVCLSMVWYIWTRSGIICGDFEGVSGGKSDMNSAGRRARLTALRVASLHILNFMF